MSKHTPGELIREGALVYALDEIRPPRYRDGEPEKANRMSALVQYYTQTGGSTDEAVAMAKLFKAAPQLLEACKVALVEMGIYYKSNQIVADMLRAAIKEAEG